MGLYWSFMFSSYLVLCMLILLLGYRGYKRTKSKLALSVGMAFGIFGITYSIVMLGFFAPLLPLLAGLRWFAYLIIALALYESVPRK